MADGTPPRAPDGAGYSVRDRRWWSRPEGEEPDAGHPPTHVAALESELTDRDRRLQELSNLVRQAEREAELGKQRLEREARREIERRVRDVVVSWLPTLDDLDRAIAAGWAVGDRTVLLEGVELIRSSLLARLAEQGIRRIDPRGEPFDPHQHEAIERRRVHEPAADGIVLETLAPGYLIGEELLRPARVVVGYLH